MVLLLVFFLDSCMSFSFSVKSGHCFIKIHLDLHKKTKTWTLSAQSAQNNFFLLMRLLLIYNFCYRIANKHLFFISFCISWWRNRSDLKKSNNMNNLRKIFQKAFLGILRHSILMHSAASRHQIVIMTVLCLFTRIYHLKECPSPKPS